MASYKILLSNVGYARGISGCLDHHIRYAHRHIYCSPDVQRQVLTQLNDLIVEEDPDICCFVEVDSGSFNSGHYSHMKSLINESYQHFDVESKYGRKSLLRSLMFTKGKSNGFVSKREYPHEKIYFPAGFKKLIYKIELEKNLTLFFAHFSLNRKVRQRQLEYTRELMDDTPGEVVFLGDFNVLTGLKELMPLMVDNQIVLLNKEDVPTFTFHQRQLVLDLCLCTPGIAERADLRVVPQPYSDHAALVVALEA